MNALLSPKLPRTPALDLREARLVRMQAHALAQVIVVEQAAYQHPWGLEHIVDSIHSGYQCVQLEAGEGELLGYYIAMQAVEEVHLLNITVAPRYQGQGWARVMLDALALWARGQNMQWLWLEVRVGNLRAQKVYEAYGFRHVGLRKAYYPAANGQREDAMVMSCLL
jgi:[ribosomal protein S18]-alanine N-acetyltransferase